MTAWTIILAAGEGSRFGGPKALAPWQSGTLLTRAIAAAPEAEKVVVVTGAHAEKIGTQLDGAQQVQNNDWEQGMGSSIAAGIAYVKARGAGLALIVPVDQPFITRDHLAALAQLAATENRCILTQDGGITGPPAAVPERMFAGLATLTSRGLKSVVKDFGIIEAPGMLRDIDTPEDLQKLAPAAQPG